MAYCGPKGIPLSTFLRWSLYDQDAALTWAAYEARRCRQCGTHPDAWNESLGGSRNAYHAENYTCAGCVHAQRHAESPDVTHGGRGVHVRLMPGTHANCPRCQPQHESDTHARINERASVPDRC
jgi:hypothetical protein